MAPIDRIPETFAELCRERSGTSIVDSGGAYGYIWQRPAIPADMPLEYASPHTWVGNDGKRVTEANLAISLAAKLEDCFEIDQRATRAFRRWCERVNPADSWTGDRSWFDLAREYVTRKLAKGQCGEGAEGLETINTYNFDNDLDQVVEITSPGLNADWHIVHVHTGCDVRGGYAAPVVVKGVESGSCGCVGLEGFLCCLQISLWCARDVGACDLYEADEQGWRFRVNKRTVAALCPKCRRTGTTFPRRIR